MSFPLLDKQTGGMNLLPSHTDRSQTKEAHLSPLSSTPPGGYCPPHRRTERGIEAFPLSSSEDRERWKTLAQTTSSKKPIPLEEGRIPCSFSSSTPLEVYCPPHRRTERKIEVFPLSSSSTPGEDRERWKTLAQTTSSTSFGKLLSLEDSRIPCSSSSSTLPPPYQPLMKREIESPLSSSSLSSGDRERLVGRICEQLRENALKEPMPLQDSCSLKAAIETSASLDDTLSLILTASTRWSLTFHIWSAWISKYKRDAFSFTPIHTIFPCIPKQQRSPSVYCSFIVASGNARCFEQAQEVFEETKSERLADTATYTAFITVAGNAGYFEQAEEAFEEAKSKRLANIATYTAFITAAGNAGCFEQAQRAFEEAQEMRLVNIVTYTAFITAAGNAGHFEQAQEAFEEAKNKLLINTVTYTAFITAAGNTGHFEQAQEAFEEAKNKLLADRFTYTAFITAAGNAGCFELARKAFEEAKSKRLVDTVTYTAFITAAKNARCFELARKAFGEMKKMRR